LTTLLKQTSRSFYLTLRVLPSAIRSQIGLAYLLARTTDTVADTDIVPLEKRLEALGRLRERIAGQSTAPLRFNELAEKQGSDAEKLLLERVEDSLAALSRLSEADQKLVRDVLKIIISGQELDLQRFVSQRGNRTMVPLETEAQLDDYTYRVAGCVGEFWTKMCRAHLFPEAPLDEKTFLQDGVRFGKGLQLVNILRDLPADLKKGRCYLPSEKLEPAGLRPELLLSPIYASKFLPLFRQYLDEAEAHLRAGWRYTNTLPFGQFRVRLACAWPVLIGMKTIRKLKAADIHQLQGRIKVSRADVRRTVLASLLACPFPVLWRKLLT